MAVGAIKNSFLVLIWKQGLRYGKRECIKTLVSGRASALFMTVWNAKEKEGFEIFKKYLSEKNQGKKQKQTNVLQKNSRLLLKISQRINLIQITMSRIRLVPISKL